MAGQQTMNGWTDIHSHILYGLDDGSRTRDEMRELLLLAEESGIHTIITTPHITPGIEPFDCAKMRSRLSEAQEMCEADGIDIQLHSGSEILYTSQTSKMLADGAVPSLAGSQMVLVEFIPDVSYAEITDAVERIMLAGFIPVIAHVERYDDLLYHPKRFRMLRDEYSVYFQMNASSVVNKRGFWRSRAIRELLRQQIIDFLATDMHDMSRSPVYLPMAYEEVLTRIDPEYADMLVGDAESEAWKTLFFGRE